MENINFNFEKFVDDIEHKNKLAQEKNVLLQQQLDAWEARRRLDILYRENPHNRMRVKK